MKKNPALLALLAVTLLGAPVAFADKKEFDERKSSRGIEVEDRKGSEDRKGRESESDDDSKKSDRGIKTNIGATSKDRAVAGIDARVASLTKLQTRIASMKRVSDANKAALTATIKSQIDVLTALKAKIIAGTDEATLKADIESITKTYRIYALVMPQVEIASASDRIGTTVDLMTVFGTKLEARIAEAKTAGKDVSALEAAYTDYKAQLTQASAQAASALALTANLKPDNGDIAIAAANKKALTDARTAIKAGRDDLQEARKDSQSIVKGLKAYDIKVEAKIEDKNKDR